MFRIERPERFSDNASSFDNFVFEFYFKSSILMNHLLQINFFTAKAPLINGKHSVGSRN